MKIRTGFVSNSSSSSFCILGIAIDREKFETLTENGEEILGDLDYEYGMDNYYEQVVIGISPNKLDEDSTIRQSKIEVSNKLSVLLGEPILADSIYFHADGGYDG